MKIKRFDQLNESLTSDQMEEIRKKFMGYVNAEEEGEIDFEYTNSELLDFAHEIAQDYKLSLEDVQQLLDTYPNDWHVTTFFGDIIESDIKQKEEAAELDEYIRQTLGKHNVNVTDDTVKAVKEILDGYKKEHFYF